MSEVENHGIALGNSIRGDVQSTQSVVPVYIHPRLKKNKVEVPLISIVRVKSVRIKTLIESMPLDPFKPISQG
jgi:hypothetical protein